MTQPMSHKVMASGDPSSAGTFTLYPAFLTPEEEYEYISTRMAELERQLGHQPNEHKATKKKKKKKKAGKEKKTKKDRKQKRADESAEASKSSSKTKKVGKKGKMANKEEVPKEKEAETMTDASMSSCEMDSVQCIGKEKEPESGAEGKTVQEEAATNRSQQRLRKAASFLFHKTSDVKAYFRKMSADIREMAAHPTPSVAEATPGSGEHQQAKNETKKTKLFKKRRSRRHSANDDQASSFGDDLNNMSSVEEDATYDLTYDPRYTDAVFVLSSSRNPHLGGPINVSDYETFSIMIEEDSTTYDSPTILPAAIPEVELDVELEEEELRSDTDSFASAPVLKLAPPPRQLRLPVPVRSMAISTQPVSLNSKASFRMSMPPVPPSAASKPHPEALRNLQPIEYLPYRSGWGARVVASPPSSFSTRTYSCSSGTIPTTARRQTGTCIY